MRGPGDDSLTVLTYCTRHYVLHVAHLMGVHLPLCPGTARDQVVAYGRL